MKLIQVKENRLTIIYYKYQMFSKKGTQQPTYETNEKEKQDNQTLKPPQPATNQVNTAGKVGKSHHNYFKVMNQHKQSSQMRKITKQELAQHKTLQSAWLSLNGVVYDVTVYINYHPGGQIILQGCGKQCYDLFNQYHPWVNAKYLLEKYRIGFLG